MRTITLGVCSARMTPARANRTNRGRVHGSDTAPGTHYTLYRYGAETYHLGDVLFVSRISLQVARPAVLK